MLRQQRRTPSTQARFGGSIQLAAWALIFLLAVALRAEQPGLFVAVGDGGRRMTSVDGLHWENDQRWSGDDAGGKAGALLDIAYGAGYFMAVGGKGKTDEILLSRDGRAWEELMGGEGRIETITFGNGHFVTAKDGRLSVSSEVSPRGFQLSDIQPAVHARRCACGDTEAGFRYVFIGDADLERDQRHAFWRGSSETGMRWDYSMLDTPEVRDIAYGAGLFVVVGPDGRIESSHDGQTWTARASTPGEEFSRIVWTGKRFFVTGGTTPWSSPDGITWTKENSVIPCRVVFAREGSISFGVSWSGDFYVSNDLSEWKKIVLPPGPPLRAVAFRAGE